MDFRNIGAITLAAALVLTQGCSSKSGSEGKASPKASESPSGNATEAPAKKEVVEQDALDALKEMSNFLMTAKTMEITSVGSIDAVTESGQRIQLDGTTNYKIRHPGFVIDYKSDIKSRRFIYDGKTFTVYSPKLGFYATVPAPPTNREVLDTIYEKFGVALPLEDLFRWSDASNEERLKHFEAAYEVGSATINGAPTDHYAFREAGVDWQIWIEQGAKPIPRKVVIIDRDDPAKPTFVAQLTWKLNPALAASDFAFKPGADDKKIALATFRGRGE